MVVNCSGQAFVNDIGKALRSYRERNNLKQEEVALRLGVSQSAISLWEKEAVVPAKKLRLRIEALIQGNDDKTTIGSLIRFVNGSAARISLVDDEYLVIAQSDSWNEWQLEAIMDNSEAQTLKQIQIENMRKPEFRGSVKVVRYKYRLITIRCTKIYNAEHYYQINEIVDTREDHDPSDQIVVSYVPDFDK